MGSALDAAGAIGELSQDVGVTGVAGGLLDHVDVDPAQGEPSDLRMLPCEVELVLASRLPGALALLLVLRDELVERVSYRDVPGVVVIPVAVIWPRRLPEDKMAK